MIEVTRNLSETEREIWQFTVSNWISDGVYLRLGLYAKQSRMSSRHKFRNEALWDKIDERFYHSSIRRADVPEPDDVVQEAISLVRIIYTPLEKTR